MTMPDRKQYDDMIERLRQTVNFYEKTDYKKHQMKLYLSNGEIIEFMFKPSCIAHLLGVKTGNLKYNKFLSSSLQLDMLKEIISKSSKIYKGCESGFINYFDVFSEYIEEKIEVFETVLKFNMSNILFACKYERARAYISGEANNFGCDYYIALETEDMKYIFLGLKKSEDEKYYTPASIISTQDELYLKKIIENQQIMLVNSLTLDDVRRTTSLRNYEKMVILQRLITISEQYNSNLIVGRTLQYDLKKVMSDKKKLYTYNRFIFDFTKCISKGKPFDPNCQQLDDTLTNLIETYNMSLSLRKSKNAGKILNELRNLRNQLEDANDRIKQQQLEIKRLESENISKDEKIEEIDTELKQLRSFKEESFQLFKKYN